MRRWFVGAIRNRAALLLAFACALVSSAGAETRADRMVEIRGTPFEVLANTDIPGFDLADTLNDPRLRGIDANACALACRARDACRALTYNVAAQACFLKSGVGGTTRFEGAISAIRRDAPSQIRGATSGQRTEGSLDRTERRAIQRALNARGFDVGAADGAFGPATRAGIRRYQRSMGQSQTGRLDAAQIDDLLAAAGAVAGARPDMSPFLDADRCDDVDASLARMRDGARVALPSSGVSVGESTPVVYAVPAPPARLPVFLMMSFDRPVRFGGEGFYALMPEAQAAFGIGWAKQATRIVVPLYVAGARLEGSFEVTALTPEPMTVEAALVSPSGCGEKAVILAAGHRVTPAVGAPRILVEDEFTLEAPVAAYDSPRGDRWLAVYEDRFRIMSSETNQPIADHVGTVPRFSPTGRFVAAYAEQALQVFDAVDGAYLFEDEAANDVAWDNRDSFTIAGSSRHGTVNAYAPLRSRALLAHVGRAASAHSGLTGSSFKIDLENDVAVSTSHLGPTAAALSRSLRFNGSYERSPDLARFGSIDGFVRHHGRGVFPLVVPEEGWSTFERLTLSHAMIGHTPQNRDLPEERWRRDLELEPIARASANLEFAGQSQASVSRPRLDPFNAIAIDRLTDALGVSLAESARFEDVSSQLVEAGTSPGMSYRSLYKAEFDDRILIDTGGICRDARDDEPAPRDFRIDVVNPLAWRVADAEGDMIAIGGGCTGGASSSLGWDVNIVGFISPAGEGPFRKTPFTIPLHHSCIECGPSARLAAHRFIVLWNDESQAIEVYDRSEGALRAFDAYRGDLIVDVHVLEGRRTLLQLNRDGSFAIHEIARGATDQSYEYGLWRESDPARTVVLYGRYADDEIVVWTPEGYFDATYEGANQVHLQFPGTDRLFTFEQFAPLIRRPGLARAVLEGRFDEPAPDWATPPIVAAEIGAKRDAVRLALTHEGGATPTRAMLYQDGVLTDEVALEPGRETWPIVADRAPGARWATVVAVDARGLASAPVGRDLGPAPGGRRLDVLAVGIDLHDDPRLADLAYAKTDAFRFVETKLAGASALYDEVRIAAALGDADASRAAILGALEAALADAGPNGDVALFFAGHGLRDESGDLYLALADTDVDDLPGTALPWSEVSARIAGSRARVTIYLDACHSGEAGRDLFAETDAVVDQLLSGGNVMVLAAAKGRQVSIESRDASGGVFTEALSRVLAMDRAAHDTDGNGVLELTEVYRGVKQLVEDRTEGRQTPWLARNRLIGDVALF